MIVVRSPLLISLGGGGTDLHSYYQEYCGFLIAAAIDKYVYITLHRTFVEEFIIKYSKLERVSSIKEIQHPIIREAFLLVGVDAPFLEMTSMADIPAGTGLGSSGSFTTALLKALHTLKKNLVHPAELAEQACEIEINRLGEPVGKQDQYIAAYGGITCLKFLPDGRVEARPLQVSVARPGYRCSFGFHIPSLTAAAKAAWGISTEPPEMHCSIAMLKLNNKNTMRKNGRTGWGWGGEEVHAAEDLSTSSPIFR